MKILCFFGRFNYGDASRGESYEYVNFIPALRRLGHEIIFFDSLGRDVYRDFAELNRHFLACVLAETPDLIFCSLMHYELWTETLDFIRDRTDAILLNWSTDDSWKYSQFSRLISEYFDIYATTYSTAMQSAAGEGRSNFVLTQWAASSENLVEPRRADECRYAVTFIGSAYGNRLEWISSLKKRGLAVRCFGHGWEEGAIPAADIPVIINQSIISLNFGDSGLVMDGTRPVRSRQIKARTFEVPGAGGFLLTEPSDGLSDWYEVGKEIEVYGGIKELEDKIRYYLAHRGERDRIAMGGYRRTISHHTYEIRFRDLFEKAERLPKKNIQNVGSSLMADFDRIKGCHSPGFFLKLVKWMLLLPCRTIWGWQRGPRAARRILFELSWRIMGKKTYSASGWPGRLFYDES